MARLRPATNVWQIANHSGSFQTYGGVARVCVPLFFMISGYLLLRRESLRTFCTKRLPKILIRSSPGRDLPIPIVGGRQMPAPTCWISSC
jgi:hypothetical protein